MSSTEHNTLFTMLKQLVESNGINVTEDMKAFLRSPEEIKTQKEGFNFATMALHSVIGIANDPAIGLKIARFISPNVFQGLGYLFMTSL